MSETKTDNVLCACGHDQFFHAEDGHCFECRCAAFRAAHEPECVEVDDTQEARAAPRCRDCDRCDPSMGERCLACHRRRRGPQRLRVATAVYAAIIGAQSAAGVMPLARQTALDAAGYADALLDALDG